MPVRVPLLLQSNCLHAKREASNEAKLPVVIELADALPDERLVALLLTEVVVVDGDGDGACACGTLAKAAFTHFSCHDRNDVNKSLLSRRRSMSCMKRHRRHVPSHSPQTTRPCNASIEVVRLPYVTRRFVQIQRSGGRGLVLITTKHC